MVWCLALSHGSFLISVCCSPSNIAPRARDTSYWPWGLIFYLNFASQICHFRQTLVRKSMILLLMVFCMICFVPNVWLAFEHQFCVVPRNIFASCVVYMVLMSIPPQPHATWSFAGCLLYHVINGDCFISRCEKTCPSPDRTACLCIAAGFTSSLSITQFVVNSLKSLLPSAMSTEDLLLVVESTGSQSPYPSSQVQLSKTISKMV